MDTYLDIETIPQQPEGAALERIAETIQPPASMTKPETIAEWMENRGKYETNGRREATEEAYRRTSFDGGRGEICTIGCAIGDDEPFSLHRRPGESEAEMLRTYFEGLRERLDKRLPYFVGHFVGGFDLRFLYQRAVVLGVNPILNLNHNGRHGQHFFDTQAEWAGYRGTVSLDTLCEILGITRKGCGPGESAGLDGSKVWDYYKAGWHDEIEAYCLGDVERVRQVARRLRFL